MTSIKPIKSGNFSWMKECDTRKSLAANNVMKAAGKLAKNIVVKGKTRKAFKDF